MDDKSTTWQTLSMDEIWNELHHDESSNIFVKPTFPTRRWGQVFTKDSTTCKATVKLIIEHYKSTNVKIRKRIDYHNMKKFQKLGKFYRIEIKRKINI